MEGARASGAAAASPGGQYPALRNWSWPDVMPAGNPTRDDCSLLTPSGPIKPAQGRGHPSRGRDQLEFFLEAAEMRDDFSY